MAAIAFSPDGKQVLTGCQESERPGESRLWDPATGALSDRRCLQEGQVLGVAFSPDGKRLALTAGNDRTVRIWKTTDGARSSPPGSTTMSWPQPCSVRTAATPQSGVEGG